MKNRIPLILTIFLGTFALVADFVIIPAGSAIFEAFPSARPAVLNFILTGPLITCVIGGILSGFLAKKFSKKHIIILAQILFVIGACGGILLNDPVYMAVMRGVVGFGYGILSPITLALISELFQSEKERSFMMGGYNAVMAAMGVAVSMFAGVLAVQNWHNGFYIYIAAIPITIMMIVFIPKTSPEGKLPTEEGGGADADKKGILRVVPAALALLVFNALYYIMLYYIAFYVEETAIGNSATSGIYSSLMNISVVVAGVTFPLIYGKIKRAMPILFFALCGLGYIVMFFSHNVAIAGIMCFLAGYACGLSMSYYFMYTSMVSTPSAVSLGMAIITVCLSLGGFLSTYAIVLYQKVLAVSTYVPIFLPVGLTLLVGGVVSMVLTLRDKKLGITL
ncbi:MAG: MFS transporter [Clostridiales Family XIII bacterium]|nr:MFS transporter [Clostridiales Family XIII bacterium]